MMQKASPPPFHKTENDDQILRFGKLIGDRLGILDAVKRLVKQVFDKAQERRDALAGIKFRVTVENLFLMMDRDLQENIFMSKEIYQDIQNCPLFLIFGRNETLPSVFCDRLALFTLPTFQEYMRKSLIWDDVHFDYFKGSVKFRNWDDININRCFDFDNSKDIVAFIANVFSSKAPPQRSGSEPESQLVSAIRSLELAAARNKRNYLAYISLPSTTWNRKHDLIVSVLKEISQAMQEVHRLKFLVFVENPADQPRNPWSFLRNLRRGGFADAIPVGRFPPALNEPQVWRRLPNLGGIKIEDCETWVEGVARAWNYDVQLAKGMIRRAVGIDGEKTFLQVENILTESDVLRRMWDESPEISR